MDGIICVNKPIGITSFDVIRKLRKVLKEKRIGHTGTLDPLATGVMVVCVGGATKLVSDIEAHEKRYIADFHLGYKTDTYDLEGVVTNRSYKDFPSKEELKNVIDAFLGDIKQVPPMYSAIKVNGQKLYDLAREGITIDRVARDVTIKECQILEYDEITGKGKLATLVSKGTYIRSLIFDIGEKLETYATMSGLLRTSVGNANLDNSYTLEEIENLAKVEDYSFMQDVEKYFNYERVDLVGEEKKKYFDNGNSFTFIKDDGKYSVYYEEKFIGLGEVIRNRIKPYKYF